MPRLQTGAPIGATIMMMGYVDLRRAGQLLVIAFVSVAVATVAVALLETQLAVSNASIVYLAAVVASAVAAGTAGAVVAAVGSFLAYDLFFTDPRLTLKVSDPGEWVSVILLLFVGVVVGQLAALQRSRAMEARAREREARALFQVSRELAVRKSTPAVLPIIARILREETYAERIWISLGADEASERVAADSEVDGTHPVVPAVQQVLRRTPGEDPAPWIRVHQPTRRTAARIDREAYRVRITAGEMSLGSIWALRRRERGEPNQTESRLLAAAADQLGGALAHDRLAAETQAAEIARQSDALKSALLQSVSHDLRTPLATIRAAAGSLRPGAGLSRQDQQESADAIDREVEYLNRLVTNLLDLSRIEAGVLRADRDVFELDDLVGRVLERLKQRLTGRPMQVQLESPLVEIDPIFLDEALTNVVENAIKYTSPSTPLRLVASEVPEEPYVRLRVEDAGGGVPPEALPQLFDKFYRVPTQTRGSRAGTGVGLAVTRGLIEATGGRVEAHPSDLGGLAIDLYLPVANSPGPRPFVGVG